MQTYHKKAMKQFSPQPNRKSQEQTYQGIEISNMMTINSRQFVKAMTVANQE